MPHKIGDKEADYVLSLNQALNQACDPRYTPIYLSTNGQAGATGVEENMQWEHNECRGSDWAPQRPW
jgi:hypothetical protein